MDKILYIVRGVSGAGKSSFGKTLNAIKIEADDYHINEKGEYDWKPENVKAAHKWCQNKCEDLMKDSSHIAICNTFTQEWEMEPYFELAKKYNYQVFTVIVENRHGGKNIHNVPEETLEKMKNRFEIKL